MIRQTITTVSEVQGGKTAVQLFKNLHTYAARYVNNIRIMKILQKININ